MHTNSTNLHFSQIYFGKESCITPKGFRKHFMRHESVLRYMKR